MNEFNNTALNLEILAEECAEVIHIKSKIIRFGLDDFHPEQKETNRQILTKELGDLLCMIDILDENGVVDYDDIMKAKYAKRAKLKKWYNHNGEQINE